MRSEVLTGVKKSMMVFWTVRPSGFVGRYQVSEAHIISIFRAEDEEYVLSIRWYPRLSPHGVTIQKTNIDTVR
jgi:hypothetical protein